METTLLPFSRSKAVRSEPQGETPRLLCFARNDNEPHRVKLLAARKGVASAQERPSRKRVPSGPLAPL